MTDTAAAVQPARVAPTEGPYVFVKGCIYLERDHEHLIAMPAGPPGTAEAARASDHDTLHRLWLIECANGRLLAASWDLLLAAQFVTSNALDIDGRPAHAAVPYEFLNDLRAAIAKAGAS